MNFKVKHGLLGIALSAMTTAILSGPALAQFPFPQVVEPVLSDLEAAEPVVAVQQPAADSDTGVMEARLIDSISSSSDLSASQPTAAEIRQARAQYRTQQRMERMERNLWAGYEPLRPNWNSIPMMSSRYRYNRTIVVPVYVYPR